MQMIRSMGLLSFFLLISYVRIVEDDLDPNDRSGLIFGVIAAIIFIRFVYLCTYIYLPCLRGETAIELDTSKLQFFIKGKFRSREIKDVIFWDEVEYLKFEPFPRNTGALIRFKMLGGDTFNIKTTHVAGKDREIYNSIIKYFKNRRQPGDRSKTSGFTC